VSGRWRYDEPEVENATLGRSPSVTSSSEGRPISMSYERLCVIRFVVWPTTRILNYKWLTVAKHEWVSSAVCLWLDVCVNYSANFYCKIALTDKTVFTSTIAYNFIQIGLGVSVLRVRDFAPLGTKWLGYFFAFLKRLPPRRANRCWHKIRRQTTRFRARKCF